MVVHIVLVEVLYIYFGLEPSPDVRSIISLRQRNAAPQPHNPDHHLPHTLCPNVCARQEVAFGTTCSLLSTACDNVRM